MKKIIFVFCFLFLQELDAQNLIPFTCDDKWGYADSSGKIKIPCQFDEAFPFYEGRALIVKYNYNEEGFTSKTESFIDSSGTVVFNLETNVMMEQSATHYSNGISMIQNYKNYSDYDGSYISLVDRKGKELSRVQNATLYSGYGEFSNYKTSFNKYGFYIANNYSNDAYQGMFIYKDGKTVKKLDGYFISEFKKGPYTIAEHKDGFALIDSAGNVVIPPSKYRLLDYGDGLVSFMDKNYKVGFVNLKGKVIIKPDFETALSFSEGLAFFGEKSKSNPEIFKFGYINKKGKVVLPAVYDDAADFSEGLAEVRIADSIFFIDQTGRKVLSFYSRRSEYGYNFDYRSGFRNGKAIVIINGYAGWIDRSGNFLIYPMYKGLQLGSPINTVFDFEGGITKISLPNFQNCYIDQTGFPFAEIAFSILPVKEQVSIFSKPNLDSILEEKGDLSLKKVKKFSGTYLEKEGIKSEWIEISEYGQSKFVLSSDFYTNCYRVTNKKGAKIYLTDSDKSVSKYIPHGYLVFPDLNQNKTQNNRTAIRIASTSFEPDQDNSQGLFYIDSSDIQKMEKP